MARCLKCGDKLVVESCFCEPKDLEVETPWNSEMAPVAIMEDPSVREAARIRGAVFTDDPSVRAAGRIRAAAGYSDFRI